MFTRNYLVIYDIGDDKRRKKLVKLLEKYGFRVQYSAFECVLNLSSKHELIKEMDKLKEDKDSIRLYKLPKSVYIIGKGEENFNGIPNLLFL